MDIPKYHETFIPILSVLREEGTLTRRELTKRVTEQFYSGLTEEQLNLKTTKGYLVIRSRIGFGQSYLKLAKMVHNPERGMVQITDKGKKALEKGALTLKDVTQDSDFIAHREAVAAQKETRTAKEVDEDASPEDLIDAGVNTIEAQVKSDLLDRLKTIDPFYFEKVVLQLLHKMGYGDFLETTKSRDGGIDGVINQDQLGLEKIFVQAKRYSDNKVREKEIRNLYWCYEWGHQQGYFRNHIVI